MFSGRHAENMQEKCLFLGFFAFLVACIPPTLTNAAIKIDHTTQTCGVQTCGEQLRPNGLCGDRTFEHHDAKVDCNLVECSSMRPHDSPWQ